MNFFFLPLRGLIFWETNTLANYVIIFFYLLDDDKLTKVIDRVMMMSRW